MADGNLAEIGREGGGHGGQRVAVNKNAGGFFSVEAFAETRNKPREQTVERLVGRHDVKIDVGRDARDLQYLVKHFAMLRRHADAHVHGAPIAQRVHHGKHLDGLRTSPENRHNLHPWASGSVCRPRIGARGDHSLQQLKMKYLQQA